MSGRGQQQAVVRQGVVQTTAWQGPIPPPDALHAYKMMVPDAPERILAMAEEEARVRRDQMQKDHDSENRAKEADIGKYHDDVRRGQIFAFLILLAVVGGVIALALNGHDGAAIALGGIGAAGIVSGFIWGRRK